jgi:hypothetical protein
LFVGLGSVVPLGGVTVTVLLTLLVALLAIIPSTTIVILFAAPAFKLMAFMAMVPLPLAAVPTVDVSQSATPDAVQFHDMEAKPDGNASLSEIPLAFDGPALVSSIWYLTAWPGMRLPDGSSFTLVTCKSAVGESTVFAVLLLLPRFGSTVPGGNVSDAVFEMVPVAEPEIVPEIVIVTELFAGKVGTAAETTPLPEMLIVDGHTAPFVAFEQVAVKPEMAELTVSEKLVPPAALGPVLLITKV